MNQGEKDELLIQLKLIELRQQSYDVNELGIIRSVKFINEYKNLPAGLKMQDLSKCDDVELTAIANSCGIIKAGARYKADTIINGEAISLKSNKSAPPALVNHTTRPGFEFAAAQARADIRHLDECVSEYWKLRLDRQIGEDVNNLNLLSPFRLRKIELKPILNYFLFDGSGGSLSLMPANRILAFTNPLDVKTWRFYTKTDAVNLYWDKLIFSVRAKKGMPNGYPNNMNNKCPLYKLSVDLWARHCDGDYRGALHIRSK